MSTPAWADPAVRIGPRAGVELRDGADPSIGVDLRLAFSRSPLTINPAFDDMVDAKLTLYRLSVTALYYLPEPIARVEPYAGIGVTVTSFAYKDQMSAGAGDDNGNRMGMTLVAGSSFALPVVSPFVQVAKGFGEFTGVSILGGLAFALERSR